MNYYIVAKGEYVLLVPEGFTLAEGWQVVGSVVMIDGKWIAAS